MIAHGMWTILAVVLALASVRSEEGKEPNLAELKKAEALIQDLGAEDFGVRESAELALKELGAQVLPLVKEAQKTTKDTEVRTRCERVAKALALEGEANPDELARIAKEEALATRYESAGKFYAKAGERFRQKAEAAGDEAVKKDCLAKAAKAAAREKRAGALAKGQADGAGQGFVAVGGGAGRVVVRMQVAAGGQVLQVGEDEEDTESDLSNANKSDW